MAHVINILSARHFLLALACQIDYIIGHISRLFSFAVFQGHGPSINSSVLLSVRKRITHAGPCGFLQRTLMKKLGDPRTA